MKNFLLLLAVAVLLTSCTQDDYLIQNQVEYSNASSNRVELSEALEIADHFLNSISGESSTRGHKREIKEINYLITSKSTRGDNSEAVYYLVNYDEGGFALLGGDRRLKSIYAISDEGSLHIEDTTSNKPLAAFINSLPKNLDNSPLLVGPPPTIDKEREATVIVAPMLTSYVRSWDQKSFNDYVREYCLGSPGDINTPIGCTVLSAIQFLSYHKYPTSYSVYNKAGTALQTYSINWIAVHNKTSQGHEHMCRLVEALGRPSMYNISRYTLAGSYAPFERQYTVFRRLGYSLKSSTFNEAIAITSIRNKKPILMEVDLKYENQTDGHAFVIDGLAGIKNPTTQTETNDEYSEFFYHFSWGHGGQGDGYYAYDNVNKTFGPKAYKTETGEDGVIGWTAVDRCGMYFDFFHY